MYSKLSKQFDHAFLLFTAIHNTKAEINIRLYRTKHSFTKDFAVFVLAKLKVFSHIKMWGCSKNNVEV